jgi:hypothetical protein
MPPERAAVYTGIEASRRPHDQLLPEDEVAVRKFDSINPVPSIFCEDAALSDRSPRFFQFAHCRRFDRSDFAAAHRLATSIRTLDITKVDGTRGSNRGSPIFYGVDGARLSSSIGNFSCWLAFTNFDSCPIPV